MGEREVIQDRLQKKETEVRSLEDKIKAAKIYILALHDILKSIDKESFEQDATILRSGSSVAKAREAILKAGKPMHVNSLLEAIGRDDSSEARASLTGSLSAYVRRQEIFTRPAPNTFGLVELGHEGNDEDEPRPPSGFGKRPVDDDEVPF